MSNLYFWTSNPFKKYNDYWTAFLQLDETGIVPENQTVSILKWFDVMYGDTDQDLAEWAVEYQLMARMLIHHGCLIVNPRYLALDEVEGELISLLTPNQAMHYRVARKMSDTELFGCYLKQRQKDGTGLLPFRLSLDDKVQLQTIPVLTNGKPVTEENVLQLIDELKKTTYADIVKSDENVPYYSQSMGISGVDQDGFAFRISDAIWGDNENYSIHTNLKNIRPGDVLYWVSEDCWFVAMCRPCQDSTFSKSSKSQIVITTIEGVGNNSGGRVCRGELIARPNAVVVCSHYPD